MAQALGTNSTIIGASVLVFEDKNGEVKESLKFRKKERSRVEVEVAMSVSQLGLLKLFIWYVWL
jgi:hypothetical protein